MKIKVFSLLFCVVLSPALFSQGIGINPTGASPNASAGLDVDFTDKGFLPPRMTTLQREAIVSPATGLVIFNTSTSCLNFYVGYVWLESCGVGGYLANYTHCNNSNLTVIKEVLNSVTGEVWMDRNLGANRSATSSSDSESFGSLFQWGRGADGHQCVHRYTGDGVTTSNTNSTLSIADAPGHGDYITVNAQPHDWRSPQNTNLWQGLNGVNNPCPQGFRLSTEAELEAERLSWSSNNALGAYSSVLKIPLSGNRTPSTGALDNVALLGGYWVSNVNGNFTRALVINAVAAGFSNNARSGGYSVRCIKE